MTDARICIKGRSEKIVGQKDTALYYGSGMLEVFATPAMIALMEEAAYQAAKSFLPKSQDTVGIEVNISHTKATPVGRKVWAEAELLIISERKLTFRVTAYDEHGEIGAGSHTRFIVSPNKFMAKLS